MSENKSANIDWQAIAEQKIRAAMDEGKFDNLPGFGKPLPGIDDASDDAWWIKAKLRREELSLLPPGLQIRVDVERGLERIWNLPSERAVRAAVELLNAKIRKAHFAAVWGPPCTTEPLEAEEILAQWRTRRDERRG